MREHRAYWKEAGHAYWKEAGLKARRDPIEHLQTPGLSIMFSLYEVYSVPGKVKDRQSLPFEPKLIEEQVEMLTKCLESVSLTLKH